MVYDLKLPLPIAGLIKPYEYFTVAWVIIIKVISVCMLVQAMQVFAEKVIFRFLKCIL